MGGFPETIEQSVQGLHKQSTTPNHMLGARWQTPDGRAFRYTKAGGTITIGRAVGHIAKTATLMSDMKENVVLAKTTAQWDAGSRSLLVRTTASATTSLHIYPNRYDDGYLWVNDDAGEGQLLQIKSHGVSTSTATTSLTITMYDDELLTVALTSASQVGLTENLYKDAVIHTGTDAPGPVLGVAPIAVTSGNYFWLQTWGPCPVMAGPDTLIAGEPAICGNTTGSTTGLVFVAGSVYPTNTTMHFVASTATTGSTGYNIHHYLQPEAGYVITPASGDAEYALVYLTCAP